MMKIIRITELPKGFYYITDTHIVEGTGEFKAESKLVTK
jgi:hypothetical protein